MASTATQVAFNSGWSVRTPHLVSNNCEFRSWATNTSLGTLSAEALRELESIMSIVDYDAGGILFLEQEPLSRVFVVLDGDVRLSLQDIGGRRLTLRIARRGAVLGMHSALFGSLSEWSADTLYPSRIGLIARVRLSPFCAAVSRGISPCDSRADEHSQRRRLIAAYRGTVILRSQKTGVAIVGLGGARQENWRPDTVLHGSDPCSDRGVYQRGA